MSESPGSTGQQLAWQPRPLEPFGPLDGAHVSISRFSPQRDAGEFVERLCNRSDAALWRYLPFEPFDSAKNVTDFFAYVTEHDGWIPYVFRRLEDGLLIGTASHMRVRPDAGSAEVGFVLYSRLMQRTIAATEAMYLLARNVLGESGYRRYEWKCNDENEASKRAARRLGFVFEGVFRQDMVVSGRNRDTAWFSLLDREWPEATRAFETWLAPENFDANAIQKRSLAAIRNPGVA
ncbi:MAG: N-acetyltransferase [Myxococcales bacterium]|jgi:RimJ/RimL family protein N-acetyltransferase|nr:MAG: N-acetyltransferase [Myxococcales bacterium]